jgi:general secretion pathway protein E
LCPQCRKSKAALPEVVEELQLRKYIHEGPITLYSSTGCTECGGVGYKGRMAILEFLTMTDSVRRAVLAKEDAGQIQEKAIDDGMETMYQDGVRKALSGLTTIEEVLRVCTES